MRDREERWRVLVVHNRYRLAGGEDVVFELERELLRKRGHQVESLVVDNDAIPADLTPAAKLRLAAHTLWSSEGARLVRRRASQFRPDILHAHNTFPLLSPAVFQAARLEGAATVQTLHNYRLICPSADLFRDGRPCHDCVGRSVAWPSVLHACYRSSRAQTATVAGMLAFHRARGTWQREIDAFVALTRFARQRLIEGGLPRERIYVKPNFVELTAAPRRAKRDGFFFAGRLEERKGVTTLIQALQYLPPSITLRVAGAGPLEQAVRDGARTYPSLRPMGQLDRDGVIRQMAEATAVVVPTRLYEGCPLTIVEAFATGTPVIASNLGGPGELVRDGVSGLLVRPGHATDLASKLQWAADHPHEMARMGARARSEYVEHYSAEANFMALRQIYRAAIARRRGSVAGSTTL